MRTIKREEITNDKRNVLKEFLESEEISFKIVGGRFVFTFKKVRTKIFSVRMTEMEASYAVS